MGKNTALTQKYKNFLEAIKKNSSGKNEKNFFAYNNISSLLEAINAEVDNSSNKLPSKEEKEAIVKEVIESKEGKEALKKDIHESANKTGSEPSSGWFSWGWNIVKNILPNYTDDAGTIVQPDGGTAKTSPNKQTSNYEISLKNLRKLVDQRLSQSKKGDTSFTTFARAVINAVNTYLGNLNGSISANSAEKIYEYMENLRSSLLDSLKNYRQTAKSYHRFRSSVGRAEIANKLTGASLEKWLNNSFKALTTTGTTFTLAQNCSYTCSCTPQLNTLQKAGKLPSKFKYMAKSKVFIEIS